MTFLQQLTQSTLAARLVCIVLLAALAGILTDAVLKVVYGAPAPISQTPTSIAVNQSAPTWLAGGIASTTATADLKLIGVMAQGAAGIALMQQMGKRAQVLHVGQSLANGTQLKSVQGKTATVLVNGELRTLTLEAPAPSNANVTLNSFTPTPIAMPDNNAQVVQQMQQLQQAAAGDGHTAQPTALNESQNAIGLKKRLGARP